MLEERVQKDMMRAIASMCLLAAAVALPRRMQAACGDDTAGTLERAVGMDCAGAMAAIPTTPGFSGEVCDFSLEAWLGTAVTVRDVCCQSCGGSSTPPPPHVAPPPPSPPATVCSTAEVAAQAQAITSVCCTGPGTLCTAARPIPGSCTSSCAELLAPLARSCGDFLAENIPALTPLIQLCLERDGGKRAIHAILRRPPLHPPTHPQPQGCGQKQNEGGGSRVRHLLPVPRNHRWINRAGRGDLLASLRPRRRTVRNRGLRGVHRLPPLELWQRFLPGMR